VISLKHRSASGDLANGWEYDAATREIVCSVRQGQRTSEMRVAVCARERLVFGAHPVTRLGSEEWLILPERVILTWPGRVERLETIRCPVRAELGVVGIALTNTPPGVSAQLEGL
jgi:hypothetical protein